MPSVCASGLGSPAQLPDVVGVSEAGEVGSPCAVPCSVSGVVV